MPLPKISQIDTSRLTIRSVAEGDLPDLFEINRNLEVTFFLPYKPWQSLQDGESWLARMLALGESGSGQQLVIEEKSSAKVIGTVLLFKHDESSSRLEIGYVLGRSCWRRGFAYEAVHAACAHAFDVLKVRRIEAEVNPDNCASCALLSKIGFAHEGLLRKRWFAKGVTYDTNIYGWLASDRR